MTDQSTESKQTINGITFELDAILRDDNVVHIWSATYGKRLTIHRTFGTIETTPNADGLYQWSASNFAIPHYRRGAATTVAAAMQVCAAAMKAIRS